MMFFFSKRCTMPETSSPLRPLNSLKMLSRSASRTRWMMFCFAACAAMRPNFSAGSLASSSSPTSASGSSLRARLGERDLVLGILDLLDDGLDLEQLDLADLGVELRLDLLLVAEGLLGRRQHRLLEGLDDDLAVDALLLAHLLDDAVEIRQHRFLLRLTRARAAPAGRREVELDVGRSMAANGSDDGARVRVVAP